MKSNQAMKKLAVSVVLVGGFILYSLLHARSGAGAPVAAGGANGPTSAPGGTTTATAGGTSAPGSAYKDGTYTGAVADAQWGYVQIQMSIQSGKISDVRFVQYPNDRERSVIINQYADPQLVTEALQAQSAQVDAITGATDTSIAFMQSLGDALSQAQG